MAPIQCLWKLLAFPHTDDSQNWNHCLWRDRTTQGALFHLEKHLRTLFWSTECSSTTVVFEWKKKSNMFHKWRWFGTKQDSIQKFVYYTSKLGSWRYGYVKVDQHLALNPSIEKRGKFSCASFRKKLVISSIRCTQLLIEYKNKIRTKNISGILVSSIYVNTNILNNTSQRNRVNKIKIKHKKVLILVFFL